MSANLNKYYDEVRKHVCLLAKDLQISQLEALGVLTLLQAEIASDMLINDGVLVGGVVYEEDQADD